MEPMAVTIHDSNETAPSWAMLVGSRMMPDPIMFTVTSVVSPVRLIFLLESAITIPRFTQHTAPAGEISVAVGSRSSLVRQQAFIG